MGTAPLEKEEAMVAINDDDGGGPKAVKPDRGKERDILQLVGGALKDARCIHVIFDGLQGEEQPKIEQVLKALRSGADLADKDSLGLSDDVFKAIDHLRRGLTSYKDPYGIRASYLELLGEMAEDKPDWHDLPDLFKL